jgi:hypothetical protein
MTSAEDGVREKGRGADGRSLPRRIAVEEFVQEGECLLYNPSRDEASALNHSDRSLVAVRWPLTLSGIAQVLGERYGVNDAMLLEDVAQVLEGLRARG